MRRNHPWDDHYCFNIQDFKQGDSVLLKGRRRAIVEEVNHGNMSVSCKVQSGDIITCNLNSFMYLSPPIRNWLSEEEYEN